jgi:hypothetical protein
MPPADRIWVNKNIRDEPEFTHRTTGRRHWGNVLAPKFTKVEEMLNPFLHLKQRVGTETSMGQRRTCEAP